MKYQGCEGICFRRFLLVYSFDEELSSCPSLPPTPPQTCHPNLRLIRAQLPDPLLFHFPWEKKKLSQLRQGLILSAATCWLSGVPLSLGSIFRTECKDKTNCFGILQELVSKPHIHTHSCICGHIIAFTARCLRCWNGAQLIPPNQNQAA
jgi:hypothetical protein